MTKCPFFGKCGGCKFDFTSPDYRTEKIKTLPKIPTTADPIWLDTGIRRRADFCFAPNQFGFYESGTKNIISITNCPNLTDEINNIIPHMSRLPWPGTGSCLITLCDNGLDIAITCNIPYTPPEFRQAAQSVPAIRITWNNKVIKQTATPMVSFDNHTIEYPSGAFLQPSISGADTLRTLVKQHTHGCKRIADLFCGLGNFTFALGADGFDIVGTGTKRDLFKQPLTVGMLNQYDCVVMDPPRAGAQAQCHELVRANTPCVIYISCNPTTFVRDAKILTNGGYNITHAIPIDQFTGTPHWEIFSVFKK